MKIKPLGDNLIIIKDQTEEKSQTGLVIRTNREDETQTGIVEAVGPAVEDVEVGDSVVYASFSGKEIGGKLIISVNDIMGIIENNNNEKKES